jgi:glycosyltransferase involved in cell wall biosynthesis
LAIPTFNRASWLKDCVLSILAQSYENFEVVVSDNASTDETQKVLGEFHDPRLRVVTQKNNIGLTPNWNACLAEAKGDFIVFVSDDDRIAPWLLDRCVSLVKCEPQLLVVIALCDYHLTAESRTLPTVASKKLVTGIYEGADIFLECLNDRISAQMCTIMIRTDALRRSGGFPIGMPYAGDMASWGSLSLTGRAGLVNERCGTCSWHDASETSRLAIDIRLKNNQQFVKMIDDAVACCIDDPQKGHEINRSARRYAARDAVGIIASYRRGGATLVEILPVIWQWRRELGRIGIGGIFSLARPIAIFLLPRSVARWLGGLERKLRARSRQVLDSYRSTNA